MSVLELSERDLCAALRRGDEAAFESLVARHHASLRRLALSYVRTAAVADEVVQETWLAVIRGIHSFEERSSLKTWIFRILANTAKTRAERESRTVPLSALPSGDADDDEPSVDPNRFFDQQHASCPRGRASTAGVYCQTSSPGAQSEREGDVCTSGWCMPVAAARRPNQLRKGKLPCRPTRSRRSPNRSRSTLPALR